MSQSSLRPAASGPAGLRIHVASAIGCGPNQMAAFDAALRATGTANYNLIRLSSVIPPHSEIREVESMSPGGGWGDRLYVVYAAEFAYGHGEAAWAGIGWSQEAETGKGLFVEHEGRSRNEVEGLIEESLAAMCHGRGVVLPHTGQYVVGVDDAAGEHTCALVIATYGTAGWSEVETEVVAAECGSELEEVA